MGGERRAMNRPEKRDATDLQLGSLHFIPNTSERSLKKPHTKQGRQIELNTHANFIYVIMLF